ncbi:MAG: hypothetical protein SFU25_10370 [Candidatus Caenarcaniphilales bacterium]|nr:hypothetical protein [Candidatus Caenarcaniphilales bacterium]
MITNVLAPFINLKVSGGKPTFCIKLNKEISHTLEAPTNSYQSAYEILAPYFDNFSPDSQATLEKIRQIAPSTDPIRAFLNLVHDFEHSILLLPGKSRVDESILKGAINSVSSHFNIKDPVQPSSVSLKNPLVYPELVNLSKGHFAQLFSAEPDLISWYKECFAQLFDSLKQNSLIDKGPINSEFPSAKGIQWKKNTENLPDRIFSLEHPERYANLFIDTINKILFQYHDQFDFEQKKFLLTNPQASTEYLQSMDFNGLWTVTSKYIESSYYGNSRLPLAAVAWQ